MLHNKRCLANAMICAIQNVRDYELTTDEGFLSDAKGHVFYDTAIDYLESGDYPELCKCSK